MKLDGAQLAILSRRMEGVSRKMSNTLFRTGRSGVLNRVRDFSCCIVNADCELIAVADALPIHVVAGPDMMARTMMQFHPDLKPGDAFLHNSPYHGCGHAADHTILVPVFDDDGRHRFTVLAKAHQADIGNSIPTTYHLTAKDVYEEGALIFPAVQVERDYQPIEDIIRMCRMRIRVPDQWWGDFLAMMGAARIGERELIALAAEIGWDTMDAFAKAWFDHSERRCIEAIRKLPKGRAVATTTHDPFLGMTEGVTIKAVVEIDPDEGVIDVDLTDNPDCFANGMNLSEASSLTTAYIGIFNSLSNSVPKNAGSLRRFRVRLRENCVCGIPIHPTSCSAGTSNITERVANAIQTAIASLAEGAGMAQTGAGSPSCGVISGVDARTGKPFVDTIVLGFTGGAATASNDAWITLGSMGGGGQAYIDSVELTELYNPIEVVTRELIPDTEGAGQYCGAPSLLVEFGPVGSRFSYGITSDGIVNAPQGVRGGHSGGASQAHKRRRDGSLEDLATIGMMDFMDGERMVAVTTGGGGYGDPALRDRDQVRRDLQERWITQGRARDVYGLDAD